MKWDMFLSMVKRQVMYLWKPAFRQIAGLQPGIQEIPLWKDNARYLRLQEISLTYNLKTKGFVKRLGIQSFDFQLVGYNLAVWSGVKTVDPEQAQKMGRVYPIPARYAFQTYIHF